eukprot:GHVS01088456.1.p2 GENE.GHVS01088456.1~~GHVS01088456.1.p2  ORF type:complete len:657 (-),score=133.77 GHVS01088456.1:2396-4366(-)
MASDELPAGLVATLGDHEMSQLHKLLLSRQEDLSRQEKVLEESRVAVGEQANRAREGLVRLAQSLLNEAHQKLKSATGAERQRLQMLMGKAEAALGGLAARRREWKELIHRCQEHEQTLQVYSQRVKSEQRRNRQLQQRIHSLEEDKARLSELLTVLPSRQHPPLPPDHLPAPIISPRAPSRDQPEPLISDHTSQIKFLSQGSGRGRSSTRLLSAHRLPGGYCAKKTAPPIRQVPQRCGPLMSSVSSQPPIQPSSPSFSFGRPTRMDTSFNSGVPSSPPGSLLSPPPRSVSPSSPTAQVNLNFNIPRSSVSLSPPRSTPDSSSASSSSPSSSSASSKYPKSVVPQESNDHVDRGRSLHYCSRHYPSSRAISAPLPCHSSTYGGATSDQEETNEVGPAEDGSKEGPRSVQVQIDIADDVTAATPFKHAADASAIRPLSPSVITEEPQRLSSATQTMATQVSTPRFVYEAPLPTSPPMLPRSAVVDVNLNISTASRPDDLQSPPRRRKGDVDGDGTSTMSPSETDRGGGRRNGRRKSEDRKKKETRRRRRLSSSSDESDEDIMPRSRGLSTSSRLLPKSPCRMLPRPAGLPPVAPVQLCEMRNGHLVKSETESSSHGDMSLLGGAAAIPADMLPEEWEEKLRKVSERLQRKRMAAQSG